MGFVDDRAHTGAQKSITQDTPFHRLRRPKSPRLTVTPDGRVYDVSMVTDVRPRGGRSDAAFIACRKYVKMVSRRTFRKPKSNSSTSRVGSASKSA